MSKLIIDVPDGEYCNGCAFKAGTLDCLLFKHGVERKVLLNLDERKTTRLYVKCHACLEAIAEAEKILGGKA